MKKNLDILKHIEIEKPRLDFTNKVMQQVNTLEKTEKEKIASLFNQNTLETASEDFSKNVMNSIIDIEEPAYKVEIFSFKQKIAIAFTACSILILSFFSKSSLNLNLNSSSKISSFHLSDIDFEFFQTPPLLSLSILCISLLIMLEYFIKNFVSKESKF